MSATIHNLVEALRLTFCKLHDVQFNAPWRRSCGRC